VFDSAPRPLINETPPEANALGGFGDAAKTKYSKNVQACDSISRRFNGCIIKRSSFEAIPKIKRHARIIYFCCVPKVGSFRKTTDIVCSGGWFRIKGHVVDIKYIFARSNVGVQWIRKKANTENEVCESADCPCVLA
jgi:hypothetical protein